MRTIALMVALVLVASPAHAQFGRLNDALNKAQKVKKLTDIKVTAEQERQIGQQVSDKLVETFGVYQDPGVTKYVTLVGSVLAQASPRPDLDWQFVVLDTDGVNAFAAPGGFIHVTRGLLGKWVVHPAQMRPFGHWLRQYYEEPLPEVGAYQFVRCERIAT